MKLTWTELLTGLTARDNLRHTIVDTWPEIELTGQRLGSLKTLMRSVKFLQDPGTQVNKDNYPFAM